MDLLLVHFWFPRASVNIEQLRDKDDLLRNALWKSLSSLEGL